MIVLALDTAQNACAVVVADGADVLACISEPMQRGHQERLAPMAAEAMAAAGLAFGRLERIGVTVGPGSFTGVRVGLAFAKAMALALDIPCVGIGTLEALAGGAPGFVIAAIDARRDQVYLQAFADGVQLTAPEALGLPDAAARLAAFPPSGPARLVGSGAPLLAGLLPDALLSGARIDPREACDPVALARLVQARPTPAERPGPLYLRAPDAKTIAERAAAKA